MSDINANMKVAGGPAIAVRKIEGNLNLPDVCKASITSIANPPGPRDRHTQSSLDDKRKG